MLVLLNEHVRQPDKRQRLNHREPEIGGQPNYCAGKQEGRQERAGYRRQRRTRVPRRYVACEVGAALPLKERPSCAGPGHGCNAEGDTDVGGAEHVVHEHGGAAGHDR